MQHNNGKFLNRARLTLPYKARARLRLGHTYQFSIDIAKPYAILHAGTDTHIPGVVYSCTMPIHSLANCYCFRAQTNNTLEMLRYYYLSDMMIMGNNWLVTFWSNWITMLNDRIIHLGFPIVFFLVYLFVRLFAKFIYGTYTVRSLVACIISSLFRVVKINKVPLSCCVVYPLYWWYDVCIYCIFIKQECGSNSSKMIPIHFVTWLPLWLLLARNDVCAPTFGFTYIMHINILCAMAMLMTCYTIYAYICTICTNRMWYEKRKTNNSQTRKYPIRHNGRKRNIFSFFIDLRTLLLCLVSCSAHKQPDWIWIWICRKRTYKHSSYVAQYE